MDVGIQVLVLLWIVLLAVTLQWGRVTNRGASIATWLGLTVVSWWIEAVSAFLALHAVLFSLGREAAIVVAIATIAIMSLTPVALAYGLRYWNRRRSAHD
jgi:hypothetical protein